jgi:hypothetical protein
MRTGPFEKYIIMTNCDYVRHQGEKTNKDISICLKTFQNITKNNWLKLCDIIPHKIINDEINNINNINDNDEINNNKNINNEKLRKLRIKYYCNQ